MEVADSNSKSGVTKADWTRNLSLHLASGAGSSFIDCRSTAPISLSALQADEWTSEN